MALLTAAQLGAKFGELDTKKLKIKSWGGEVEIRRLTIAESNNVTSLLYKDGSVEDVADGKVELSPGKLSEAAALAASYALVSPKMTLQKLQSLSSVAMEGVTEIKTALDTWDTPKKSKGVNRSSASHSPSAEQSES